MEPLRVWTLAVLLACIGIHAHAFYTSFSNYHSMSRFWRPRDEEILVRSLSDAFAAPFAQYGLHLRYVDFTHMFTAALVHANPAHLLANMAFWWTVGRSLERRLGTWYFFVLFWLAVPACGYTFIALTKRLAEHYGGSYNVLFGANDAIYGGLSGVLYCLYVLDLHTSTAADNLVRGLLVIGGTLVYNQVMVPQASFIGHLAGIAVGYLFLAVFYFARPRNQRQHYYC